MYEFVDRPVNALRRVAACFSRRRAAGRMRAPGEPARPAPSPPPSSIAAPSPCCRTCIASSFSWKAARRSGRPCPRSARR